MGLTCQASGIAISLNCREAKMMAWIAVTLLLPARMIWHISDLSIHGASNNSLSVLDQISRRSTWNACSRTISETHKGEVILYLLKMTWYKDTFEIGAKAFKCVRLKYDTVPISACRLCRPPQENFLSSSDYSEKALSRSGSPRTFSAAVWSHVGNFEVSDNQSTAVGVEEKRHIIVYLFFARKKGSKNWNSELLKYFR